MGSPSHMLKEAGRVQCAHRGLTHLGMDVRKDSISIGILAPDDDVAEVDSGDSGAEPSGGGDPDLCRARKRLGALLLRHREVWRGGSAWTVKHHDWLAARRFDDPAMAATFAHYRGVVEARERELAGAEADPGGLVWPGAVRRRGPAPGRLPGGGPVGAVTLAAETCDWRRFGRASAFMGFTGLIPPEYSSGAKTSRGHSTKAG